MDITQFALEEPDHDGDMGCSLSASFINETEHEIRLIRSGVLLCNKDGVVCAGNHDIDEVVRLEPGEEHCFSPNTPWAPVVLFGDARDDVVCRLETVLYGREVLRLGEIEIPPTEGVYVLVRDTGSTSIAPVVRVILSRGPTDRDGDVRILGRCGIRNLLAERIDRIVLRAELIDEDDLIVRYEEETLQLDPFSEGLIEFTWWSIKKSALKAARMRCSLAIYRRVAVLRAEAISEPQ